MQVLHTTQNDARAVNAVIERLHKAVAELRTRGGTEENFEGFEAELHAVLMDAECEILAEELQRLDVNRAQLLIDGQLHHRVLRSSETYTSAAGPVKVWRTLYRRGREAAVVPLELRAGIVGGQFTPRAARQGLWAVAHLTPQEAEDLFREVGNMSPSKSSLDRLPKQCSIRWEAQREDFEAQLRAAMRIPEAALTVAVSLDGVMTPMKDGARAAKREQGVTEGKRRRGPAGYQEVGCATLSFHDAEGERLSTVCMARMPEAKRATVKRMLAAEVAAVLQERPGLRVVKLADGAKDNWTFLSEELPGGEEIIDFYHAAEHLKAAFAVAYGEHTPKARTQFETYRHILRVEHHGIEKVIRTLAYLRDRHPRRKVLATELGYFRRNRARMHYAEVKAQGLPIGSGVVEAACKTLVTQRMKRSGMRWRHAGGQAILTLRALAQSQRFDHGWRLLAQTYRAHVAAPDNVVAFPGARIH
jgi:hypothetical protein